MKAHIAWQRIQQIRESTAAWQVEARKCWEIFRDAKNVFRLERGRTCTLVTIVGVASHERVRIRREDNGKEYWVDTYFINPNNPSVT